jgi:hypothetical protein
MRIFLRQNGDLSDRNAIAWVGLDPTLPSAEA